MWDYRLAIALILLCAMSAGAHDKRVQREALDDYVLRMQPLSLDLGPASPGSLWTDNGRFANLALDYKASRVGDVITILVVQDVAADNAGSVSSDRTFNASSGIDGLAGKIRTNGLLELFSPHSTSTLKGKAQASSSSRLRTSVAGQVKAVLANGVLVVEAERQITMNNERQTILLRGLVRPGDVAPNNIVLSNAIGNLEFELKGKGVLTEGTRPPNAVMRVLLRIVGF